jgi:hypothetical protein
MSMWCDDFDADLLRVVPGAAEVLGTAAGIRLTTRAYVTDGTINHPLCWHTDQGIAAFFWTCDAGRSPAGYVTNDREIGCTFLEAVRDEWVHDCLIVVDRRLIWRPRPNRWMMPLMYDVRGWKVLDDSAREQIRQSVCDSLRTAAAKLLELLPESR